jgi:hypothetical protein
MMNGSSEVCCWKQGASFGHPPAADRMNGDRQIAAEPLDRRRHVPRAVQYCIEALLAGIVSTVA